MDERIMIMNGPNVYMGQDDAGNIHYKGHWKGEGGGTENQDFFGPLKWRRAKRVSFGPKKSREF